MLLSSQFNLLKQLLEFIVSEDSYENTIRELLFTSWNKTVTLATKFASNACTNAALKLASLEHMNSNEPTGSFDQGKGD